jgi:hypothetical protein
MAHAGQEELTTIDGLKVSIKELVRGQPSKDNEVEAFAWLRDSGNGGIIKSKLEADLGKADQEKITAALAALAPLGIRAAPKQTVHWQTLGALSGRSSPTVRPSRSTCSGSTSGSRRKSSPRAEQFPSPWVSGEGSAAGGTGR